MAHEAALQEISADISAAERDADRMQEVPALQRKYNDLSTAHEEEKRLADVAQQQATTQRHLDQVRADDAALYRRAREMVEGVGG